LTKLIKFTLLAPLTYVLTIEAIPPVEVIISVEVAPELMFTSIPIISTSSSSPLTGVN
jgi:hypothetical protein